MDDLLENHNNGGNGTQINLNTCLWSLEKIEWQFYRQITYNTFYIWLYTTYFVTEKLSNEREEDQYTTAHE
jgi:hypothetical protein